VRSDGFVTEVLDRQTGLKTDILDKHKSKNFKTQSIDLLRINLRTQSYQNKQGFVICAVVPKQAPFRLFDF
jgi:hypothetical protein